MLDKPTTAEGYKTEYVALVRATCLYVATKLGDLMDDLVVVGGLVPSLIVDQETLAEGMDTHVGTMDLSLVIKHLDQAELQTAGAVEKDVETQTTRFSDAGSYVEFASEDSGRSYWEVPLVRDVRSSVKYRQLRLFKGSNATLEWEMEAPKRRVYVWILGGAQNMIHIRAQLSASEVWHVLETLKRYEHWTPGTSSVGVAMPLTALQAQQPTATSAGAGVQSLQP